MSNYSSYELLQSLFCLQRIYQSRDGRCYLLRGIALIIILTISLESRRLGEGGFRTYWSIPHRAKLITCRQINIIDAHNLYSLPIDAGNWKATALEAEVV